jgi:hypothetical protein
MNLHIWLVELRHDDANVLIGRAICPATEALLKKRSVLLIVALVAVFGAIGGVAAVASADHGDAEGSSAFIDRVAELLGLAPEDVSSAIAQARDEGRAAHFAAKLDEAVEAGVITREEADAIAAWATGKPDALRAIRHHGLKSAVKADGVEQFLTGLVEQELITQAESDEISAWVQARPPAAESLREWRIEQFKNGDGRFHHGWRTHGKCGLDKSKSDGDGGSTTSDVNNPEPV